MDLCNCVVRFVVVISPMTITPGYTYIYLYFIINNIISYICFCFHPGHFHDLSGRVVSNRPLAAGFKPRPPLYHKDVSSSASPRYPRPLLDSRARKPGRNTRTFLFSHNDGLLNFSCFQHNINRTVSV